MWPVYPAYFELPLRQPALSHSLKQFHSTGYVLNNISIGNKLLKYSKISSIDVVIKSILERVHPRA